jgi:outer membrane protein assembly factor BamB
MLWQLRDVFDRRVVASPIVAGDLVIGNCGEAQAGRLLIAVRPGSKDQKPLVAYTLTVNPPYVPTPLAKGDLLFLLTDSGVASCLRASTGKLIWQQRLNAPFYGSFVCVADRLYAISRKGDVFVLSASEKFQLLARNPLGENSYATPAIANGRMYLRTYSHLICLSSTPKQPP